MQNYYLTRSGGEVDDTETIHETCTGMCARLNGLPHQWNRGEGNITQMNDQQKQEFRQEYVETQTNWIEHRPGDASMLRILIEASNARRGIEWVLQPATVRY